MATSDIGKGAFLNVRNKNTGEIEKKTLIPPAPSDGDLGGISEEELAQITTNKEKITSLNEEIIDGRTDVDGEVHENIGDAMRGQARKLRENLVVRQKEQPTDPNNNVWISDEDDEVEVPDMGEFNSLKEDLDNKIDNYYNTNEYVMKRTSSGSVGSHYLINYSVSGADYQILKFTIPTTGIVYKIEFLNPGSNVLKTIDTSIFNYGHELFADIPADTSKIVIEVAFEVGNNLEITLYKKIEVSVFDIANSMKTVDFTNRYNLLIEENITDNLQIQPYTIVSDEKYTSAFIPIKTGETLYVNYSLGTPTAYLCNSEKQKISFVILPFSNDNSSRNIGYTVTSENVEYIRLSWPKSKVADKGKLFFGKEPIRFIEPDNYIKEELIPELSTGHLTNWWNLKTGDSLGDSLTGQGFFQSWTRRYFGLTEFANHGVGGSKLSGSDIDSTRPSMWKDERINALNANADFITVLGGQNDGNVEIGELSKNNKDTNTYVGALNTIIDKIYDRCGDDIIIILCCPFWVPSEGDNGTRFVTLGNAVKVVAQLHGLPVADFGGLCGADYNTANRYWGTDKTHPIELFYKEKIAPILISTMEKIKPIDWEKVKYYTES